MDRKLLSKLTVILLVTWGSIIEAQRKTAFEGTPVTITCPTLHRILITQTKYADRLRGTAQCSDPNARDKIVPLCEQKQTCTFTPDQTIFDSTCNEAVIRHRFLTGYRCFLDLCAYYHTFCDNGGSCMLNRVGAPYCSCRPGYGGMNCEFGEVTVTDPCSSTNCGNGKCELNSLNQPVCACTGNWTGDTCEVSPCRNETCLNGGSCFVTFKGEPMCLCNGKWKGSDCSESPCLVNPCLNGGTCDVTDSGIDKCVCLGDWLGYYCSVSPCTNYQLCQNNGTCSVSTNGTAVCQCENGFAGTFCSETAPKICVRTDLMNNAAIITNAQITNPNNVLSDADKAKLRPITGNTLSWSLNSFTLILENVNAELIEAVVTGGFIQSISAKVDYTFDGSQNWISVSGLFNAGQTIPFSTDNKPKVYEYIRLYIIKDNSNAPPGMDFAISVIGCG